MRHYLCPMEKVFSPMLAERYAEGRVRYPCFVQPKLDGFRATFRDGHMFSRSGHRWADSLFEHFLPALRRLRKGTILDGELYRHGWRVDKLGHVISLFRKEPCEETFEVGFYVFDTVRRERFEERLKRYAELVGRVDSTHVQAVPAVLAEDRSCADELHRLNIRAGFEGTMYRVGDKGYEFCRTMALMKRKEPGWRPTAHWQSAGLRFVVYGLKLNEGLGRIAESKQQTST